MAQQAIERKNNKTLVLTGLLIGWVAGVYMLAITMFMPIIGKLADLFGRKRVYLSCMALFISGSIVCGLAQSMEFLLIGRGIQGIGAGGLMPLALVIIGDTFPLEQRAKVQSIFGPLMILPQLLGPTVGGYIVSHTNWQARSERFSCSNR